MEYNNIVEGVFLSRPNRFIAKVQINGKEETVHVKNTGRCKELLVPGAKVYLARTDNPDRKTKYDLVSIYKNERLINMDSQAPNKIFGEWLSQKVDYLKPEYKYGNSRFDFYGEHNGKKFLIEVKGVTLEQDGVVMFPDAPTERGVKHIEELIKATKNGFETAVVFIIQMDNVKCFKPNDNTHKQFGDALRKAVLQGVKVFALDCTVTKGRVTAKNQVEIVL
ncbi:MAG: DNA/RNA nuclease SfsA [Clostridia bacterium]|nr:DNA/RNA nuclease SfsA [Clostridia bacterium]